MISPGLLVAFTLASAHPTVAEGRAGPVSGTAPRALVPGEPAGGRDGLDAAPASALLSVGREVVEAERAGFSGLLVALLLRDGEAPLATPASGGAPAPDGGDAHPTGEAPAADSGDDETAWALEAPGVPAMLRLPVVVEHVVARASLTAAPDAEDAETLDSSAPPAAIEGASSLAVPEPTPAAESSALATTYAAPFAAPAPAPQVVPGAEGEPVLEPGVLRGLDRDFARRLTRVADRMRSEFGITLEVVEGLRTQLRQNDLFNQGRTEPGPIVTWTTESLHTIGKAADVHVGGAPVTPEAALLLARVAREEGLRTLYPLDSGHIQVDAAGVDGSPEGLLPRRPDAPAVGLPGPRRGVAPVAPVAPVAEPARPAGIVARDAEGSGWTTSDVTSSTERGSSAPELAVRAPGLVASADNGAPPMIAAPVSAPASARMSTTPDAEPVPQSVLADPGRFEPPAARPYGSVHVPLDVLGAGSSLRVGLRGSTVDARLSVADPLLAADLSRGLRDLGQQLGLRGLEMGDVAVRLVNDVAAETARPALAASAAHDQRASQPGASPGSYPSGGESPQGRSSGTSQDTLDGRERGTRQRRDTKEDRPS